MYNETMHESENGRITPNWETDFFTPLCSLLGCENHMRNEHFPLFPDQSTYVPTPMYPDEGGIVIPVTFKPVADYYYVNDLQPTTISLSTSFFRLALLSPFSLSINY